MTPAPAPQTPLREGVGVTQDAVGVLRHRGLGNRSSKRGCENAEKPAGGWRKDAEKRAKKIKDGAVNTGSWVPGGADG